MFCLAIVDPGQDVPGDVDRARHREPAVARRIAVRVGRAGSAGLAETPRRVEPNACGFGEVVREHLGRAAHPGRGVDRAGHPGPACRRGVDDRATEVVRRRAGDRQQGGGDQAARRSFGDHHGLATLAQQRSDSSGGIGELEVQHPCSMSDRAGGPVSQA